MTNKSKLGLLSICLLGVNAIIGTGIFLLPGRTARIVGVASIPVILFDAVLVICLALCFAEAGGLFKKNGGPYVYAKEAFGEFVGFEVGFMKWAISIIAWAAMAVGFATVLGSIFPAVRSELWKNIIAISIMVLLSIMNILGVRLSKIMNNIVTIGKISPLLFFIVVGIFFIQPHNFAPMASVAPLSVKTFGEAALLIFYAFTGFESIAVAAEDMDNPKKHIPLAILLVICCVSIVYVLIQIVSIGVLGAGLVNSDTPVADASARFFGTAASSFVTLGTLISIGGINLASSFIAPRSAVALADDGLLPAFMSLRNKKDVPYVAVILTVFFSSLICLTGSFTTLAAISVVSRFAQYIPTCLAVLVFRKRGLKSSFVMPLGPIIPLCAVGVSVWLLFNSDLKKIIIGLGGLVLAGAVYGLMKLVGRHS